MKFLLFFVSFIFSSIFYSFYNLSRWKNFFWDNISNLVEFSSLSNNLLIESFTFLFIWIVFLYFFSGFSGKWESKLWNYKIEILYFLYYIVFIFYLYFVSKWIWFVNIVLVIIFILSDTLFNHISNLKKLANYKLEFRYVWLILNYVSSFLAMFLININWLNFVAIYILIFNIYFNFLIHKKYINYISLMVSIIILLFFIYRLYFYLLLFI